MGQACDLKSTPKAGKCWDQGATLAPAQPWPQSWCKVLEDRSALITFRPHLAEAGTERAC